MAAYTLEAFDYKFDFSTTGLAVGANARVGTAAAYTVAGENQNLATPLTLPSESFGEVAGIEVFPGTVGGLGGQYEHADYIKLYIGGQSYDDQFFNELVAPGLTPGQPDPLGAAGLRYGNMPINFGMPMLLGGRPEECCPKIPAGKPVEIEIGCPPAAEGGVALAQPWTVRLWMVKVNGVQKMKDILKFQSAYTNQGYFDGNVMNCSFDLGDLEVHEKMPVRTRMTNNPIKNLIPEQGAFDPQEHWGKMPGGMEQDRPKMHVYSVFAKQMLATTINEWYQFTAAQQRVQDRMCDLYWDFTRRDALKITHLGFKQPAVGTIRNLWLRRSGRELEQMYEVQRAVNPFPMPRNRAVNALTYCGPTKLVKPLLGWNEIMSIEMKDNATSVLPWASGVSDQAGIYVRGIRYELNDKEV
jgi:hypothetical protein